jgi:RND family efflux transporter MFP subunit
MSFSRVAAIAAAILFSATACQREAGGPPGGMAFPPAAVKLEAARLTPIEQSTEYVAVLKSLRSTPIQPQVDGQITQIFVTSGQRVGEGVRLVQIDARRQQAALSSQEAERAALEADVSFARQQASRARELHAGGAISQQELEQTETAVRTAEARLQALSAQVQQQTVQLRYYTVTAPTAGVVGDVPVRVGNLVTSQTVLTTIDANDTLEVHVQVPIERAADLRNGLPLQIVSGDGREQLSSSAVRFISPHVDNETQSVLVKGLVPNPTGTLRASQYVRARVVWKTTESLVIPVTAVLRVNGQYFAFVAEESRGRGGASPREGAPAAGDPKGVSLVARQRAVTLGQIAGNNYVVLSGLNPGEQIVVSGVQRLADGAPIAATT